MQVAYSKTAMDGQQAEAGADATVSIVQRASSASTSDTTVRLQVAFDTGYFEAHAGLERQKHARNRKMDEIAERVLQITAAGGGIEIQDLSGVQKQLLDYCSEFCSSDPAAAGLKPSSTSNVAIMDYLSAVQKEMAMALESVFPRVCLRNFAALSSDAKVLQMNEVARLVLGIRLYNWDGGRGGTGLEHTPSLALQEAQSLLRDLEQSSLHTSELCSNYVDVLCALNCGAVSGPVAANVQWPSELANRRQTGVYLSSLAEELRNHVQTLQHCLSSWSTSIVDLKRSVSGAATVSKEAVYPHFQSLADSWILAAETRIAVAAMAGVHSALKPFVPASSVCTVSDEVIRSARKAVIAGQVAPVTPLRAPAPAAADSQAQRVPVPSSASQHQDLNLPIALQGYCPVTLATPISAPSPSSAAPAQSSGVPSTAPSSESVSLGILENGDFKCGLARWRGLHFVCASEAAMEAFAENPEFYLQRLGLLALQNWELVHILHLVEKISPADFPSFPYASLPSIVQFSGNLEAAAASIDAAASDAAAHVAESQLSGTASSLSSTTASLRIGKKGAAMVDAGVETPVHFVERHIDPRYEFSEWALRRRAVQIANLRKCATTSIQTDASHFRRDNDAQVYLPKEQGTQTGISVSTNTERVVQHHVGIRGAPEPFVAAAAARKAAGKPALPSSHVPRVEGPITAKVIQLTLDC